MTSKPELIAETSIEIVVEHADRIDRVLAQSIQDLTRSQIQQRLREGHVKANGVVVHKTSMKVDVGTTLKMSLRQEHTPIDIVGQNLGTPIVYEDADIVAFNKPAGLVVHPGPGHPDKTLVNMLLYLCPALAQIGMERPGLVHRLDKDTSGLIMCAKNMGAHQNLSNQFKDRSIDKYYTAFVYGEPKLDVFEMRTLHARHPKDRLKFTTKGLEERRERSGVREAVSFVEVLGRHRGLSKLLVKIETGRTHQIRVQLSDMGFPIIGDQLYGGKASRMKRLDPTLQTIVRPLERQALHATRMCLRHPITTAGMALDAPLSGDLKEINSLFIE